MAHATPSRRWVFYCGMMVGLLPSLLLAVGWCAWQSRSPRHVPEAPGEGLDAARSGEVKQQTPERPVQQARPVVRPKWDVSPRPPGKVDSARLVSEFLPGGAHASTGPIYLGSRLAEVPEVTLEAPGEAEAGQWRRRKAKTHALALVLNAREEDGFMKGLLAYRKDLAGLPIVLGGACRSKGEAALAFKQAAMLLRQNTPRLRRAAGSSERLFTQTGGKAFPRATRQIMPEEPANVQLSLLASLASCKSEDARDELARQAVFAPEVQVRGAAAEGLPALNDYDPAPALLAGLKYPWPVVADNAATAIVRQKRDDLVPALEAMLVAPDPRAPRTEVVDGREQTVAYELVRANHLRNCLLCHAPMESAAAEPQAFVAQVPVPGERFVFEKYYRTNNSEPILVRVDVTYLRQDFSAMLSVSDWTKGKWPAIQRYDFFLRRRVLTDDDAADLRKRLAGVSAYRQIAADALRQLTGRDYSVRQGAEQ